MNNLPLVQVGVLDYGYVIPVDMGIDLSAATAIRAVFVSDEAAKVFVDLTVPATSTTVAPVTIPEGTPLNTVGMWKMTVAAKGPGFEISSQLIAVSVEPRALLQDFWT